jgi:hypothetical protein
MNRRRSRKKVYLLRKRCALDFWGKSRGGFRQQVVQVERA